MRQSVKKGEPLSVPAEEYNAFLQMANDYRTKSVAARPLQQERHVPHGLVRIKNTTGVDLARFSVLGIDGPLFSHGSEEYQNRVAFVGGTASSVGKIAIIQEPLAADAIGLAVASGVSVVKIDVTDGTQEFATVEGGGLKASTEGEIQILDLGEGSPDPDDPGKSIAWARVNLGHAPSSDNSGTIRQAILTETLTGSGTANAKMLCLSNGWEAIDESDFTVRGFMLDGHALPSDTQITVVMSSAESHDAILISAACPIE